MKRGTYKIARHAVTQPLDKPYRLIPLTQGQTALVDAEDFDWLSQWNWHAVRYPDKSFYAARFESGSNNRLRMHTAILGCVSGEQVDHVNHDTLDNRRYNLRKATHAQNSQNRRVRSDSGTGLKGVEWRAGNRKWMAYIKNRGKRVSLGHYPSSEEAAKAYDRAALVIHGEFAHLNFPPNASVAARREN